VATAAQWVSAARPRTLPAAVAPVLVGCGAGAAILGVHHSPWTAESWLKAALALIVALALQVGVNYANDYSDGIRGTDGAHRVGPFRLVGSGAAPPQAVKAGAITCFAIAAAAGLVLAVTSAWWLILVGAASIAAAWFYTGGKRPYGYAGFGELFVFVFFGLVAVLGTTYVIAERISLTSIVLAVGTGLLACAILVANNLRDVATDGATGKRTLAVILGDGLTRRVYAAMLAAAFLAVAGGGAAASLVPHRAGGGAAGDRAGPPGAPRRPRPGPDPGLGRDGDDGVLLRAPAADRAAVVIHCRAVRNCRQIGPKPVHFAPLGEERGAGRDSQAQSCGSCPVSSLRSRSRSEVRRDLARASAAVRSVRCRRNSSTASGSCSTMAKASATINGMPNGFPASSSKAVNTTISPTRISV
jgi:1,4-dihydroxy-2-naphthoate octaprenyltransferase